MSNGIELYVTTGSYRAAYDHLNQSEYLGSAKVLDLRNMSYSDDYGSSYSFTQRIVVGRWFNPSNPKDVQRVQRSIAREFRVECRCEHDCCGCLNGSASIEHVKGREFLARANYGRNC